MTLCHAVFVAQCLAARHAVLHSQLALPRASTATLPRHDRRLMSKLANMFPSLHVGLANSWQAIGKQVASKPKRFRSRGSRKSRSWRGWSSLRCRIQIGAALRRSARTRRKPGQAAADLDSGVARRLMGMAAHSLQILPGQRRDHRIGHGPPFPGPARPKAPSGRGLRIPRSPPASVRVLSRHAGTGASPSATCPPRSSGAAPRGSRRTHCRTTRRRPWRGRIRQDCRSGMHAWHRLSCRTHNAGDRWPL